MTAKKRPPTHKQASNDFSHHSQNYTWFDKIWKWNKITDMEGKSMDRLGWMGGGVGKWIHFWLFCHATLKRQGCSSQFCSDSSAVCEMWKNKNSISLHHWQRIHSQLCHAAEFSILLDTESISSALVKERRFFKNQCCRAVSYHTCKSLFTPLCQYLHPHPSIFGCSSRPPANPLIS